LVAWFVGQSLLFVVMAFVLGLLVGWLWWGRRRPAPAAAVADAPTAVLPTQAPATGPLADMLPAASAAAGPTPDDELERIEGIGPRMAGALRTAGIRTYAALAGADDATLRTAIENAGLSFAPSLVTWARQARLLADGDEDGFAELTRRLVAGRDTGRM
jgi:predicted flap endonuclease-1-like 5' DNA nuclease